MLRLHFDLLFFKVCSHIGIDAVKGCFEDYFENAFHGLRLNIWQVSIRRFSWSYLYGHWTQIGLILATALSIVSEPCSWRCSWRCSEGFLSDALAGVPLSQLLVTLLCHIHRRPLKLSA
jgi:hypothetical protein